MEAPPCSQDEYYLAWVTSPETTIVGEACKAVYYMGESIVTVGLMNGQSVVDIDEKQYNANRKPLSPS
ncbi:hypothetical protein NPX13_g10749 [Xylaria arbuscula]|uniref:Uncharacterized protein n=1 Tax=Xylaria arbuscula TaxID=114810 RepID=A0A9W8N456_9PEZI|nr:hypothetical protein NPX13_g10749 [Xylaria arbuscula]